MPDFDTVLPRLVATYEAGRLVPFIGSGMSLPVCTDWWTFIRKLEAAVAGESARTLSASASRDKLIRRANSAVRELKAGAPGDFERAVRNALVTVKDPGLPEQTKALARLWWPLVLSTNYDNCYEAAFHESFKGSSARQLLVVGRGIEDCQRVLNSLSVAGRSLLWALQGYLDAPHSISALDDATPNGSKGNGSSKLREQLVVGHEEYRRVTYRDLDFRRAFAEVFRQRSLLFLGSGIQETYLQELFGEVLEYYGPSTRPHYAFVQKGDVDPNFMLARFQIVVVEYKKYKKGEPHQKVVERLNQLADAARFPSRAPVSWSWGRIEQQRKDTWTSTPDLEVVRGPLPTSPMKGECLAVSAGGASTFSFSKGISEVMEGWGVGVNEHPEKLSAQYLGVFPGRDVYAVRARSDLDERSLAHIYDAALALFKHVTKNYNCVRMQLLAVSGDHETDKAGCTKNDRAAGGADKCEVPADIRYPERFSFVQIVRAWATWRSRNPNASCRLALHIDLDSVYQDIASGRIDVLELLSCRDIRFFVEIVSHTGEVERRLFQNMPNDRLGPLVQGLGLSPQHWTMNLTPPASLQSEPPLQERLDLTLHALGVVPGSTLHFRRA